MRTRLLHASLAAGLLVAWLPAGPAAGQQLIQGLPEASPRASVQQTIGMTEITIDYHRPGVKGRKIWGALVPFDQVWRAGANDNTTITFSSDVKVEGQALPAGTYGLHMIPTADQWTVIFSTNSTSWGSFTYDPAEDALRVAVKPQEAPFEEWLRYDFEDLDNDSGVITLSWEKLKVPFSVEVDTQALALAYLRRELRHLPRFTWLGWMNAAAYCLQNNINHDEALTWIDRSIAMNPNFNNLQVKANLLAQAGRTEESEALFEQLLGQANEAQANTLGYQMLQAGNVQRAIEIFQRNVSAFPESWNTYDSLAEAYAQAGQKQKAIENYSRALEMAPEAQKPRIEGLLAGLKG